MEITCRVYKPPRPVSTGAIRPETTALYEVVRDSLETLYGAIGDGAIAVRIAKHARKELEAYLDCGQREHVFAKMVAASAAKAGVAEAATTAAVAARARRRANMRLNLQELQIVDRHRKEWGGAVGGSGTGAFVQLANPPFDLQGLVTRDSAHGPPARPPEVLIATRAATGYLPAGGRAGKPKEAAQMEWALIRSSALSQAVHLVAGLVVLFVGAFAIRLIDRIVFRRIDLEEEIGRGNLAAAVLAGSIWIALALVFTRG